MFSDQCKAPGSDFASDLGFVAGLDFDRGFRLVVGLDFDRDLSRAPLLIGIKVGPGQFLFIAINVWPPVWILIVI